MEFSTYLSTLPQADGAQSRALSSLFRLNKKALEGRPRGRASENVQSFAQYRYRPWTSVLSRSRTVSCVFLLAALDALPLNAHLRKTASQPRRQDLCSRPTQTEPLRFWSEILGVSADPARVKPLYAQFCQRV